VTKTALVALLAIIAQKAQLKRLLAQKVHTVHLELKVQSCVQQELLALINNKHLSSVAKLVQLVHCVM